MKHRDISLIIPVCNEASLLESSILSLVSFLEKKKLDYEIILVENGSTDASLSIAEALVAECRYVRLLSLDHADYGNALKTGFLSVRKEIICNMSVDWIDTQFLSVALSRLGAFDMVLATKHAAGSRDRRSALRKTGGVLFHLLVRALFSIPVSDTHGIKVMKRRSVLPVLRSCRFSKEIFDTELVVRSCTSGLSVCEIPVSVVEKRPTRVRVSSRFFSSFFGLISLRFVLWREGYFS